MRTATHGRPGRLPHHDYRSPGAYFITIITRNRGPLFGRLGELGVELSVYGWIAALEWSRTSDLRPGVRTDAFVVMPDHLHGILMLDESIATVRGVRPGNSGLVRVGKSVGAIIAGYKAAVTARCRRLSGNPTLVVWQSRFQDRVVRDERELARIRRYIASNPQRAILDRKARTLCGPTAVRSW